MASSTIPASGGGGLSPKYVKYTSSGTFTLPDGYGAAKPLLIDIQVIGGGGGGAPAIMTGAGANFGRTFAYGYYGNNFNVRYAIPNGQNYDGSNVYDIKGGGSGGLAKTQMYLTSNLTITVGAAGSRSTSGTFNEVTLTNGADNSWANATNRNSNHSMNTSGGTGGTSTAGSVSAAGGNGAVTNSVNMNWTTNTSGANFSGNNSGSPIVNTNAFTITGMGGTAGNGGTPSGTAGDATPLLGTLAGGSGTANSIFGSFGIGGKRGDIGTNTGVEGTGGGSGSVGAPGAVIITYWS
jgi:hypothetical protein